MRGALVTVEGVEGSGKSTQCARLARHLGDLGLEVVQTSEPDGTPLGRRVRALFKADGPTPTPSPRPFCSWPPGGSMSRASSRRRWRGARW